MMMHKIKLFLSHIRYVFQLHILKKKLKIYNISCMFDVKKIKNSLQ